MRIIVIMVSISTSRAKAARLKREGFAHRGGFRDPFCDATKADGSVSQLLKVEPRFGN
jgi:hypothetical protein